MDLSPDQYWIEPELKLWRAVLDQALLDFMSGTGERKRQAQVWLRGNSADFKEVCEFAMVRPQVAKSVIYEVCGEDALWETLE